VAERPQGRQVMIVEQILFALAVVGAGAALLIWWTGNT
jgi:hypothetical protein